MDDVDSHRDPKATATDCAGLSGYAVAWISLGLPLIIAFFSYFAARSLGLSLGWLYVANFAATHAFGWLCVRILNPVVISRRSRLGKNTKKWDFAALFALTAGIAATTFVAMNDPTVSKETTNQPGLSWLIAAFLFALGYGLALWCSVVNPFLENTVRIQADNQHRVIQTGPYAYVRHPMYVGLIAVLLATPLMLDSWWTYIPVAWCIVILVIRTALEDRTLQSGLSGYQEYTERVCYRLIPGLW